MSELYAALAKAQSEMKSATFDKVNPHFKSKYASLSAVIDAVRDPLTRNGIAYVQRVSQCSNGVGVETVFLGHGGEFATGVVVVPLDKPTAQGMGSALTYARRYSLAMACCISADEDDDGNEAEKHGTKDKPAGITMEDVAELQTLIVRAEMTPAQVCEAYKVNALAELTPAAYRNATSRLLKRIEQIEEAA